MARMASDTLHSRVVAVLKITLPLLALALLSSLFLFSRPIDPEDAIPYADVEIADRLAQPRMSGAGFSTVTSDGATLTLTAERAAPVAGGAEITGLNGQLIDPAGAQTDFTAARARLDRPAGKLELQGGVKLSTSTGYQIMTDSLSLGTDRSFVQSGGSVQATAPMGELTSGGMRMDRKAADAPYLLVFNKGVRLIYQPQP
jgi:lipopolysaccharide export system protein LptC